MNLPKSRTFLDDVLVDKPETNPVKVHPPRFIEDALGGKKSSHHVLADDDSVHSVEFVDVIKTYTGASVPALRGINLTVDPGEFVFIIGSSGSGKSTLLRMIIREDVPDAGAVVLGGKVVNRMRPRHIAKLRRKVGVVFQDFRLLPDRTVLQNVAFVGEVTGMRKRERLSRAGELLVDVGLAGKGDRFPDELSGGEQQRVAVARALMNHPDVVVADEPTGNLDPETSRDIMELFEMINRTGTTVLIATHDEHMVNEVGQRVVELSNGNVVSDRSSGYRDAAQ